MGSVNTVLYWPPPYPETQEELHSATDHVFLIVFYNVFVFEIPLGFTILSQQIYPWARFELPSRRHCSEKLGAVALLYFMIKKGML